MICLLSPAKTLDFEKTQVATFSQPIFIQEANLFVQKLKKIQTSKWRSIMTMSERLAEETQDRFNHFVPEHTITNAKQAVLTYKGDVYRSLDAINWTEKDFVFAQENVKILSGLYGILRPLDLIQPYRLEMGARINLGRGKNLYAFWEKKITQYLVDEIARKNHTVVLNLASNEYIKAIDRDALKVRIVTPSFKEYRNGELKFLSFQAKKARGMMTQYMVKNKIDSIDEIKGFAEDNYAYDSESSTPNEWIFTK